MLLICHTEVENNSKYYKCQPIFDMAQNKVYWEDINNKSVRHN